MRYSSIAIVCMFIGPPASAFATDIFIGEDVFVTQTLDVAADTITIAPQGSIMTSGGGEHGIALNASDHVATVSGAIVTLGSGANGIHSIASNSSIALLKGGSINASSVGIVSIADNAHIVIERGAKVSGVNADANSGGIRVSGEDTRIENAGQIAGSNFGIDYSSVEGRMEIVNAGRITGPILPTGRRAAGAIYGGRSGTPATSVLTFDLHVGSVIEGRLIVGDNTILKIAPGLNTYLSFFDAIKSYDPETGTADLGFFDAIEVVDPDDGTISFERDGYATVLSNSPHLIHMDGIVLAVDPSRFALADDMLNDLTGTIANTIGGRLHSARKCSGHFERVTGSAPHSDQLSLNACGTEPSVWASAIGHYRQQDATDAHVGSSQWFAGLVAGADRAFSNTARAGLYGGYAHGEVDFDGNPHESASENAFIGGYYGKTYGSYFIDLGLTAGVSWFDEKRHINNNMIIGGMETAEGDTVGYFISPTATFGTDIDVGGSIITPSVRGRYSFMHVDGYTERGAEAALNIDSYDVHVLEVRGQLELSRQTALEHGILTAAVRTGVDGIFNLSNEVNASFAGQNLVFDDRQNGSLARGFAGFDIGFMPSGGSTAFTVGGEAGYDSNNALTIDARAGFIRKF